ncbi:MAG: hypothetical protein K1X72_20600 [Pyrinomonadaceae bacterium]|nr:hypothetical protein [Pyrinomonadaceae bacterium]
MFPIILAHGIARFDILREKVAQELNISPNSLDDQLQYFRNIRTFLELNGFTNIKNTNVQFANSVTVRAETLTNKVNDFLIQTGAEKVHIIAHSMGGLDARWMIVKMGMAEKVASLTTIGTPHLGTVLADRIFGIGGNFLLNSLENLFGIELDGFKDLTTEACNKFNDELRDAEVKNSVVYQTYASYEHINKMFLPLVLSWAIIRVFEETNDGLVPFSSQKWTDKLIASDGADKTIKQKEFPIPADHLNQVGWWDSQEAVNSFIGGSWLEQRDDFEAKIKAVYLEIANGLKEL